MQKISLPRFQAILVGTAILVLMILFTACASNGTIPGQSTTGGTATATTQVPSTVTQPSTPPTTGSSTPVSSPVAFKAGGISFIGTVKNITSTSLVMSAPNGQTYTLAITTRTDRSAYSGGLPTVGSSVDMDSSINPDESLTATILKPARPGDPDQNVIAYTGITTSAVGANRVIHFTVGTKAYTFTIPQAADLTDYSGNAQAIGNNASVKVKVQYPANTVVSVGNAAASTGA